MQIVNCHIIFFNTQSIYNFLQKEIIFHKNIVSIYNFIMEYKNFIIVKIYIIYTILNIITRKIKNVTRSEKNIKKTNLIFSFDKKEKKRRKKERKKIEIYVIMRCFNFRSKDIQSYVFFFLLKRKLSSFVLCEQETRENIMLRVLALKKRDNVLHF